MAKRKNENEEINSEVTETTNQDSSIAPWEERYEGQALAYLRELEKTGGDLVHPGKGCILTAQIDCIYSYSVFKRRHNKKVFIELLQDTSDACQTAKILAYCVLDDMAFVLVKGNRKEAAEAFVEFVMREYAYKYNRGLRSVGNPFRKDFIRKQIPNSQLGAEINRIHSFSPNGIAEKYPFCSYRYLLSGEHDANLILKMEIDPSREDFESILQGMDGVSVAVPKGVESYASVKADIERNFSHQDHFREEDVGFMLSETAARSQTSYSKVAKKMGLERRYDLMVNTVSNFINRRKCTYSEAVSALGLQDTIKLRIEVIAEINRIHHYSYDFIVRNIVTDGTGGPDSYGDKDGTLLVKLFTELNKAYGYTFEQLCVRFHITQNLIPLRRMCGL